MRWLTSVILGCWVRRPHLAMYSHSPSLDDYQTFRRVYEVPIVKSRTPEATAKELEIGEGRLAQLLTISNSLSFAGMSACSAITCLLSVSLPLLLASLPASDPRPRRAHRLRQANRAADLNVPEDLAPGQG